MATIDLSTWTDDALRGRVLVGTDQGTHGGPETVDVYEDIDGNRTAVYSHGGAVTSRETLATLGDVASKGGRMRWLAHPTASHRKAELARRALTLRAVNAAIAEACRREERQPYPPAYAAYLEGDYLHLVGSYVGTHERVRTRLARMLGVRDVYSGQASAYPGRRLPD